MQFVMNPVLDHYAARRATGIEKLQHLKGPVILVANHASHMDTPMILSALPRRLRKRTAVAAAADYFYRNRIAACAGLAAVQHRAGRPQAAADGGTKGASHLDKLLDDGWNLLLYPEGTPQARERHRSRPAWRRGAGLPPQPLDRADPRHRHRCGDASGHVLAQASARHAGLFTRRHRIEVSFGEPIPPHGDAAALIERVQNFFDANGDGAATRSPYRRRGRSADAPHRDVGEP